MEKCTRIERAQRCYRFKIQGDRRWGREVQMRRVTLFAYTVKRRKTSELCEHSDKWLMDTWAGVTLTHRQHCSSSLMFSACIRQSLGSIRL
jgi:hypothetical protein